MFKRGARLDLIKEINQNRFLLILLPEKDYSLQLKEIVKSVEKTNTKVCYVCLSKPFTDVKDELKHEKIDTKKFFFIDVLSSHYKTQPKADDCIFIKEPAKLTKIKVAITKAVEEKKCSVVLIDTISTLLIYQQNFSIIRFSHELKTEREHELINKVFIVLKEEGVLEEESRRLVKDLEMFADKTIYVNHPQK